MYELPTKQSQVRREKADLHPMLGKGPTMPDTIPVEMGINLSRTGYRLWQV